MEEMLWAGFKRIDFEFEGRHSILVFPDNPDKNKNWMIKTEYFGAFPSLEIELVKRGWHLAYIENVTRWCIDEDLDLKKRFADYLIREYGLNNKCVPIGMSCGGLIASKFAARHPEYVHMLYLDAPVMNFLSCPAGIGKAGDSMMQEFTDMMGMDIVDLINYRDNPVDKMDILIKNNIPVVMVYGDSDDVVPYDENGKILENYYLRNNGNIVAFGKKNCGHHPHCLEDNTPVIDFILNICG